MDGLAGKRRGVLAGTRLKVVREATGRDKVPLAEGTADLGSAMDLRVHVLDAREYGSTS